MSIYVFGPFRLHAERLSLTKQGRTVAVGPRVVETLLALVESAGSTVNKNALMERVWPDAFVEESNLTQNIYVLRKLLRAESLPYAIETVPRVGYRFTVPVRRLSDASALAPQPLHPLKRRVSAAFIGTAMIVASLLVAASHGAGGHERSASRLSSHGERLYEVGEYYWGLRTRDGVRESLKYFAQVVDADPLSARGYAALADANVAMGDYCYGTHLPAVYFARAHAYAEKALALDPDSADAHAALGFLALGRKDADTAINELQRAVNADPSDSTAHQWYGIALLQSGVTSRGLDELQIAQRLNPLSVVATVWLGSVAYRTGNFAQAIVYARETLELAPRRADALRILGDSYEAQGKVRDATAVFKQLPPAFVHAGAAHHRLAIENAARLLLRRAVTPRGSRL
jgi:DNA-binding winged helix-turn-helix (wHTH) protein/Tfp pilus assembly protein PilF